ncbi:putative uvrABC complex, subunit B [Haemophilus haemolyticus M21127]|nr:putative uvrABC complex, subunit B [Haemophilus haemolyticus M21127]
MNYQDRISNIFSVNGELSQSIKGFRPRTEQIEMAHAVGESIQNKSSLIIEAGTGTGKTFAYLAPALVFGKKTIISTGSKNLQDQLFNRDLPAIKKSP